MEPGKSAVSPPVVSTDSPMDGVPSQYGGEGLDFGKGNDSRRHQNVIFFFLDRQGVEIDPAHGPG
jgi:hypothetical protein